MPPFRSRLIVALFALALLGGLPGCQDDQARLAEHVERGDAYYEEERFREAIIEFKSALQLAPNDPEVHYKLAHAYLRAQKAREGFWELRETVRLDPSNHEAVLEFGQLAILAGEREEALRQVSAVVEADPGNLRAHLVKGQALDSLERRDEALQAYQDALAVDPKDSIALRAVGRAYLQRDMNEEAIETHQKLVEYHPSFESYSLLSSALARRGRKGRADQLAALEKALEVSEPSERLTAYAQLASHHSRMRRTEQAFQLLEQGLEKEDDEVRVQLIYLLASMHRGEGNLAKADELIERTQQERPDDPRVHLVLSAYRGRKGDLEGALASADKALELEPDNRKAQLRRAEVLMEMGYRDEREGGVEEARTILDSILAAEPTNPDALFAQGKLRLGAGDHAGAIDAVTRALEARPQWAQAHYLLGLSYGARKDYAEARNHLTRALEIDNSLLDAKNILTQVHFNLEEWEYTVERGRQYLTEMPDDHRTRLLVTQALVRLERILEAEEELARIPGDQRSGEVLYAMARISLGRQQFEKARELLLAANEALPNHAEVLQNLLVAERRLGKFDEAKARVAAALAAEPENPRLIQLQAAVDQVEGRNEEAEARFQRAIELAPEDMSGYEKLARFYSRSGRLEDTAKTYEKALEVKPSEARFHHMLGMLYELSGDDARAIERYEAAIRLRPDFAEAKNNLAYLYAEKGDNLDRALDLAQDAKALLPDSPSVADTLGWVLFKRGVPAAAISYLKEAEAATKPQDASLGEVRYHLAQAYDAAGEREQALASLDRALEALQTRMDAIRESGRDPGPEPDWADDARAMRERVAKAGS